MNEEDIFPTFDSFGPLKDVSIIRDKQTQLHRGCAFVTYWSSNDADKAQESLHGKHVFPGARRPAQVKPAEPSVPENKLFVGMLSRKAGEDEISELFAPFGEIREIYMIRNADGSSKCAAFLRYVGRDSAIQAIEILHNNLVMEGSARPLIVKFADNKLQRAQRHMRNVRRQELMTVMGPGVGYPGVYPGHHMAMAPPPGAPSHQYPPHHQMGGPPHAHHLPQYHGAPYPGGPGGGGPQATMYNPMYPSPQHYGGPPHPYGAGGFQNPNQNNRHGSHGSARGGNRHHNNQNNQNVNNVNSNNPNQAANPRPREGPAGANLFVYHLPHDLTYADLATAFNPFGNVISAKVYVDRYTAESKGFGFVSYDSVISAESAIEQMNGFQIGNKRLKVQHKRVHNNGGGNRGGGGQGPAMNPHEHYQQQQQMQQQFEQQMQPVLPLDYAPPDHGYDAVSDAPSPVIQGDVPPPTSQIGDISTPTPVMIP
jgi:CUG-BP- and ETR3-like factor